LQTKFSRNSKVFLTAETDGTTRLWDATTGAALGPALPITSQVGEARLNPDGKAVLFVGKDKTVWISDGATGSVRGRTHTLGGMAYAVEFSPDGKTFFTGLENG